MGTECWYHPPSLYSDMKVSDMQFQRGELLNIISDEATLYEKLHK